MENIILNAVVYLTLLKDRLNLVKRLVNKTIVKWISMSFIGYSSVERTIHKAADRGVPMLCLVQFLWNRKIP